MSPPRSAFILFIAIVVTGLLGVRAADTNGEKWETLRWKQHDIHRPRPPVVAPATAQAAIPAPPPLDAIVLFDGTNLDAWKTPEGGPARWSVKDGVLEVVPGAGPIQTKSQFGDVQLHVEWAAPTLQQASVRTGATAGSS